jgi:hypothetical protein
VKEVGVGAGIYIVFGSGSGSGFGSEDYSTKAINESLEYKNKYSKISIKSFPTPCSCFLSLLISSSQRLYNYRLRCRIFL